MAMLILPIVFLLLVSATTYVSASDNKCSLTCGRRDGELRQAYERVFGGTVTEETLWPWTFQLMAVECDGTTIFCTAQYIGSGYFITAAHCLFTNYYRCRNNPMRNRKPNNVAYDYDKLTLRKEDSTYTVAGFWAAYDFDPNAEPQNYKADIAIVKSVEEISARPICLASRLDRLKDTFANLVAYGLETENGTSPDHKLRHAEVQISPVATCKLTWGLSVNLCAGAVGAGGLIGDSGGALVIGKLPHLVYFAYGILSHYKSNNNRQLIPDVFSSIPDHCEFINRETKGSIECLDPYKIPKTCDLVLPEGAADA